MEKIPETFDWVDARAKCSTEQMFSLLVERVTSDVESMKARIGSSHRLTFNRIADDKVIVANERIEGGFAFNGRNVMFQRTKGGIVVDTEAQKGPGRALFTASVSLGPEGRCRYEVDGQPLELWQVSRKALEELFFS
jgi:hypothetical protein